MKPSRAALLLLALLAPAAHAASLKCGKRLVSEGATQAEVQGKCGEPAGRNTRTELLRHAVGEDVERVLVKTVEEWTYNFGPHRFLQTVVFENGVLVDVRSGDYGY